MKQIKWLAVLCAAAVLLAVGTFSVFAQNPPGNDPAAAMYLDNQPHTIPGGGAQWYRFDYGGGNSLITVALINGAGGSLRFNVFTPEQIADWTNATPIGRGTVLSVNCNSGLPAPAGACERGDLLWEGRFRSGGTYYVQLLNDSPQPVGYTLTVAGEDVVQCVRAGQSGTGPACAPSATTLPTLAQTQGALTATAVITATRVSPTPGATQAVSVTRTITTTVSPGQTTTPAPATNPSDTNAPNTFYTSPYHALPLNGQMQILPAGAAMWYRFEYNGDGSDITLRMENGALNGLQFAVYLPEQAPNWWNENAIGHGTGTTCNAGSDTCGENANARLWSGKFRLGGTYFVRVQNPTPNPVQFALTAGGTGVSVCAPNSAQNPALAQTRFGRTNLLPCPTAQ